MENEHAKILNSKTIKHSVDYRKYWKLASFFKFEKYEKYEFLNFKIKIYETVIGSIENRGSEVYILKLENIKKCACLLFLHTTITSRFSIESFCLKRQGFSEIRMTPHKPIN